MRITNLSMADRPRYYVSLGDSISIDAYAGGTGCGAASLLFRNRDDLFPDWQGRDLKTVLPGVHLIPRAMDAATSASVRYVQLPQLLEMRVLPQLATITIGGNDLLQAFGNDAAADAAHLALREHGEVILQRLRTLMGQDAPILLGTIYDPSDGTGDSAAVQIMAWPSALSWLHRFHRFNETLTELAANYGAILTDIHAYFLGHGITVGSPAQEDPRPANRELYYCGVIEPNGWGAGAIRALWWETLVNAGFIKEPTT
jgi:lysophospholipase L1-like esterase